MHETREFHTVASTTDISALCASLAELGPVRVVERLEPGHFVLEIGGRLLAAIDEQIEAEAAGAEPDTFQIATEFGTLEVTLPEPV